MKIGEMFQGVRVLRGAMPAGAEASGVSHDSRRVRPGDLFVAVRGLADDGLAHAQAAVRAGARTVVVGPGRYDEARAILSAERNGLPGGGVSLLEVEDERVALALLSRNAAGRPDSKMKVTGVTGTNGKTTTAHLLAAMSDAAGTRCGLLGTVEYRLGGEAIPAVRTTPEASEIHEYLVRMLDAGAGACVMEVSSHALDLHRVDGIRFAACIFTNLTQDHLDYHGDMETYFLAKRRLFMELAPTAPAIVNADDPHGERLARETGSRAVLYGTAPGAAFRLEGLEGDVEGSRLSIEAEGSRQELRTPLVGRPNAYNLLAATAAARCLGISWEAIREGAERCGPVSGRLERIVAGQPFAVIVDYAHTDDALRNVLLALRPLTPGRILIVFGAGGDRDKTKRPLMGEQAARLSDIAWITSDNPRGEDPMAIIRMVHEGALRVPGAAGRCRLQPDRAAAIAEAIAEAREGDTVLIAGKGHETTQVAGGRILPFDDADVARRILGERRSRERNDAGRDVE